MNRLTHLLYSLLCALGFVQINALMYYNLLENSDHKTLLILGEDHMIQDAMLTRTFEGFLETVKQGSHKKPLTCLVELAHNHLNETMTIFSSNIKKIIDADRLGEYRLRAVRYDPRSDESSAIHEIMYQIRQGIVIGVSPAQMHTHYKTSHTTAPNVPKNETAFGFPSWEALRLAIEGGSLTVRCTVLTEGYLRALDKELEQLRQLVEFHTDSPKTQPIFKKAYETFRTAHEKIHALFDTNPKNMPLAHSILKLFVSCRTIEERLTAYDTYYNLFIRDTDQLIADSFYANKILELLKDEPCLCFLGGHSHATSLGSLFSELDFKSISSHTMLTDNYPLLFTAKLSPQFSLDLCAQTKKLLKPLEVCSSEGCCQKCFKKPEQLLRCSRCKDRTYCGVACQKSDWVTHKLSCTIKVTSE